MSTAGRKECTGETKNLLRHDVGFEFFLNALRLTEGFPISLMEQNAGMPLTQVRENFDVAEARGWLERDLHTVRPTETGQRFLNDLISLFLPQTPPPTPHAS